MWFMDGQFTSDEHAAKADFEVSPDSGPGEEAASFKAPRQDQFLGGGGGPEVNPQKAEQKTYLPDQKLTEQEKRAEGKKLIRGFVDIFKEDPDVQRKVVEAYFRYEDSMGRSGFRFPSGDIFFKRGTGEYWLRTTGGDINKGQMFRLQRKEGNAEELIEIRVGMLEHNSAEINYNAVTLKAKNNGNSVIRARELLAKEQKDFGKIVPSSPPNVAQSQ